MASARIPQVASRAIEVLDRVDILHNPYLEALVDGSMPLANFLRTQEQFFFAVTFFPRPMAALVGRLPDPAQRLDILRNLVEEHGEFEQSAFHHTTFQEFLRRIGSEPEKLDLWPAVRAFNSVLTTACLMDEIEVGIACMGVIEQAFAASRPGSAKVWCSGGGWPRTAWSTISCMPRSTSAMRRSSSP